MKKSIFGKMRFLASLLLLSIMTVQAYADKNYKLPSTIQEGVILHCFDWKFSDITANLDMIAAAGFTAVQTSPAQTNYEGPTSWRTLYRPRDSKIGPNTLGNADDLKTLCREAHKRGMKVIVDVVANHTDGKLDWVADFWKNLDLYHNWGTINDYHDRRQVIYGEIGMKDLKTEDARVQQKFKEYVAELKAAGVDGCRWDAAKHIGLPSEGDSFWANVPDQSMYNYGEILDDTGGDDGKLLPEYLKYISVTDAVYSTKNVLANAKEGKACPTGYGNYSTSYNTNKLVYWGESHDTYCNPGYPSDGVDQSIIDRAYAVAASHNVIPALYFSRPFTGTQAKAGEMGTKHFADKAVAVVNRFHNAMNGKSDWYECNEHVSSITRKNGGAVVVNFQGAGWVSVKNGGKFCQPGTYTDSISGNKFQITNETISGNTDWTGIAVLYKDTIVPPPLHPYTPTVTAKETSCFLETTTENNYKIWVWDANHGNANFTGGTWPGASIKYMGNTDDGNYIYKWTYGSIVVNQPTGVIFTANGNKLTNDDLTFVNHGYYKDGKCIKVIPPTDEPTKKVTVYVSASNAPYLYVWDNNLKALNGNWPGKQMTTTKVVNGVTYYYQEFENENINIIFNNGRGGQTADITGVTSDSYFSYNGYSQYSKQTVSNAKGNATGIENVKKAVDNIYYNLYGERVASPGKGVYIFNGKKVVLK